MEVAVMDRTREDVLTEAELSHASEALEERRVDDRELARVDGDSPMDRVTQLDSGPL
jgi:hypothetical protein